MGAERIVVAGAGSIGCFVGGLLAAGGANVTLLARRRIVDAMASNGLRISDFRGLDVTLTAEQLPASDDPELLRQAGIVLVTVKSAATAQMAALIAAHAPKDAVVVSLQNGVGNVGILAAALPDHRVIAGMVPFNVVMREGPHVHRGTGRNIVVGAGADLSARLSVPNLTVEEHADMAAVQYGKLLINLNNALNALSGLPLREQLQDRRWRLLFARQVREALAVYRAKGIRTAALPVPASLIPLILSLPDGLFGKVAAAMVDIDPQARSSMWEDLQAGRTTEIDELQGAILAIGATAHVATPLIARVREAVRAAENAAAGSPALSPDRLK